MLIYLDSSDLINLCRGTAGIEMSDFRDRLTALSHRVVFSLDTLLEIAAPVRRGLSLEVRRHLNRLEELPHTFINEARIRDSELREAVNAFERGREYDFSAVTPFAPRLDEAIDIHGKPQHVIEQGWRVPTRMILNLRIAEVIHYLWDRDPHIFDVQRRLEPEWIRVMRSDRALKNPPALPDHFVTVMIRDLATHRIRPPSTGAGRFARWVYEVPSRCPGIRLTFEAQHRFRRDRAARPTASDIIDLARIASVPYVDLFLTDGAMMNYCAQAAKCIGHQYPQLLGDFPKVLSHLGIR